MVRMTWQSYFGWVAEVGDIDVTLFRDLSTEPDLVKDPLSDEEVLVMYAFSMELPRVRDPRDDGFVTLEERAWGFTV